MGEHRTPTQASPYYLPKHKYLAALQYALQYEELKSELNDLHDNCKATGIDYSKDRVQAGVGSDQVFFMAERIADVNGKLKKISSTIVEVAPPSLQHHLFLSVCRGYTYYQLRDHKDANGQKDPVPLGKNAFSRMRQCFYFELSKKI